MSSSSHLKILVPIYGEQKFTDSSSFVEPFYFDNRSPSLREFQVYSLLEKSQARINCDYLGVMSDLFSSKCMLPMTEIEKTLNKNPGFDVYIFNPFPHEKKLFYNLWSHGEFWHPGIVKITEDALYKSGFNWDLIGQHRNDDGKLLFCNYWVGSSSFFYKYVEFLVKIADVLLLDKEALADTEYAKGKTALFPFIVERLFTSFLYHNPEIRVFSYDLESLYSIEQLAAYPLQVPWVKAMEKSASNNDSLFGNSWPQDIIKKFHSETSEVYRSLVAQGLSKELRY